MSTRNENNKEKKERRVIPVSFKNTKSETWLWEYVCAKTDGEDKSVWIKDMIKIAIKEVEKDNEEIGKIPF